MEDEDLVLWFTPGAIREHFEADTERAGKVGDAARAVMKATDEELRGLGEWCLGADTLYLEFHRLLTDGAIEVLNG